MLLLAPTNFLITLLYFFMTATALLLPVSRRTVFQSIPFVTSAVVDSTPSMTLAAADCFSDCFKNCQAIAPKNIDYCKSECTDYCEQPDRTDGLSGSISADTGEVGILGGAFGSGTVVKGRDKPPSVNLPGLDFTTEQGKRLIGY